MTMLRRIVEGALMAALMGGLAGCASGSRPAPSQVMEFRTPLSGSAQVPPNSSTATGMAEARFDRQTQQLTWTVTYSGLSGPVTAAHIHGPAVPGSNAPVLIPFTHPGQSPITGSAQLTPTQATQLVSGLFYVNLHTAANPGGEIRGQLIQAR
jgi:hypothetical protein